MNRRRADQIGGERRAGRRYEIKLDMRWTLVHRGRRLESGSGITVDLSSGGILFASERELPIRSHVELSIAWPILLNQTKRLQLVVKGYVVRVVHRQVAIRIDHHEFRLRSIAASLKRPAT